MIPSMYLNNSNLSFQFYVKFFNHFHKIENYKLITFHRQICYRFYNGSGVSIVKRIMTQPRTLKTHRFHQDR